MIEGRVDDYGALIPITIGHPLTGITRHIEAWVDTAFTSELLLSHDLIAALWLPRSSSYTARFANASEAQLPTFQCRIEWFGKSRLIQAGGSAVKFPLIGIGLLEDLVVRIDYPARTVTLTPSGSA